MATSKDSAQAVSFDLDLYHLLRLYDQIVRVNMMLSRFAIFLNRVIFFINVILF